MKLKVKDVDISTGGTHVAIMNEKDAGKIGAYKGDRIQIKKGNMATIAIIDIAESTKVFPTGTIALFEEVISELKVNESDIVDVSLENKPDSIQFIKNKLNGKRLAYHEIYTIVKDIVDNKLSESEITYFVSACYINALNTDETVGLTKAMVETGETLKLEPPVFDVHCIGGVAGNRTTPIVVPIVAAAGLVIPKTSSRAITSPAGTADTLEVITPVSFTIDEMRNIVKQTNGCMVWGGAVLLAPADDKIIKLEYSLGIDAQAQMLASVIAKKKSVSATHVLIDIPVGKGAKIQDMRDALFLKKRFKQIGQRLGITFEVMISNGSQPIGNGIGPVLEMKDVLKVLKNSPLAPLDLKEKSISMAGLILEMGRKAKRGDGKRIAKEILDSGKAFEKFVEIINAQHGKVPTESDLEPGKFSYAFPAYASGKIVHIDSNFLSKIARAAGNPQDKKAGVYLHKHMNQRVTIGEPLLTVYAQSKQKLSYSIELLKQSGFDAVMIK